MEQIQEMEKQINVFLKSQKEGIYVFFCGVVNHWVTIIAHKPKGTAGGNSVRFFLLDSLNVKHLHLEE